MENSNEIRGRIKIVPASSTVEEMREALRALQDYDANAYLDIRAKELQKRETH